MPSHTHRDPAVLPRTKPAPGLRAPRIAVVLIAGFLLAACATAPQKGGSTAQPYPGDTGNSLEVAFQAYDQRDFARAISAFEAISSNQAGSADDRRCAYLGTAMVRLSTDREWRDLQAAQAALQAAREVAAGTASSRVQTNLLAAAVENLVNVETDNAELARRSIELARELDRSKASGRALETEREALLAEQQRLEETLERLKELTLGN